MSYKILKIPYGSNKPSIINTIDTTLEINDIKYINDFGFILVLSCHHCLGYIDTKGQVTMPWIGQLNKCGNDNGLCAKLNYPASICYSNRNRSCHIVENGGTNIRYFYLKEKAITSEFGTSIIKKIEHFFINVKDRSKLKTSCDIDSRGTIYWVVNGINRCFRYSSEDITFKSFVGNGHGGFSTSSDLNNCKLSSPESVAINKNVYIADTGNNCIRKVSHGFVKNISVFAGQPCKNIIRPSKIIFSSDNLYFIDTKEDTKEIRCLFNNKLDSIYGSDKMVSISCDNQRNIFVLEKS